MLTELTCPDCGYVNSFSQEQLRRSGIVLTPQLEASMRPDIPLDLRLLKCQVCDCRWEYRLPNPVKSATRPKPRGLTSHRTVA